MEINTENCGFWIKLSVEQARYIHKNVDIELFALHDDGSESAIYTDEEFQQAIDYNEQLAVEARSYRQYKANK